MKKIVIFGAGNIGRSFIAQLFSKAGYEIVFIEIDSITVEALNSYGKFRIEVKDIHSETIWVENVRGVNAKDSENVRREVPLPTLLLLLSAQRQFRTFMKILLWVFYRGERKIL